MRHAEAANESIHDRDRILTQRGIRHAIQAARWLQAQPFTPELILFSQARRCEQTAQLVAEHFPDITLQAEPELYQASSRVILNYLLALPAHVGVAMLVGHNPHLSYFAEWLCDSVLGSALPAQLWAVELDIEGWHLLSQGLGCLVATYTPSD